jgi:glycerophosphoryl diester phosphodiesterase
MLPFYGFRVELSGMPSPRLASVSLLIMAGSTALALAAAGPPQGVAAKTPWLIAHRGASAYAPENTVPAFRLAADQGATFVEFDIQLTKDRQLVCLHDNSLERTTDVEAVFPDRFRTTGSETQAAKRWMIEDFTLAEIRRLDAGAWFDQKFRGTRIPTFSETIDALRGRSGLFIELKSPERYEGIERLVLAGLKAAGLAEPGADPRTPVLLQSFSAPSLQALTALKTRLPIHFLVAARDAATWMTADGLTKIRTFATGLSPEKTIIRDHPDAMARARTMRVPITPYTFRSTAVAGFPDVRAEMAHFLRELGVDGVITDNPDMMPSIAGNR